MGDGALTTPVERSDAAATPGTRRLTDLLVTAAEAHPKAIALQHHRFRRRELVTFAALHDEVRTIAKGIAASGVQPGDRVAILAEHGPSWLVADLAAWYAGAVVVPLHPATPPSQVEWALMESGARGIFLGSPDAHRAVDPPAATLSAVANVWRLTEEHLDRLAALGTIVGDDDLEDRRTSAGPATPATIVYGSDGARPLGAVLTHGSLGAATAVAAELLRPIRHDDPFCLAVQSIHPAHALGQVLQLACLRAGVCLGFGHAGQGLADQLAQLHPSLLVAEPSMVASLLAGAAAHERADGRSRLYDAAAAVAVAYSASLDASGPGPTLRARHALFERTVYPRIRGLLGGRLTHVLCGGAALEPSLAHTLRGAGVDVVQLYGPRQSAGLAAVAQPGMGPTGPVVRPLPGVALQLAADGELLIRGPQVFAGYYNEERASRAAFTEGWLRSGDRGEVDDTGALRLAG